MSLETFSRGRTVYGNGSFAPNRGSVSGQGALGYLQREIRKPNRPKTPFGGSSQWGADGQSDTRSGVAAGMLAKQSTDRNGGGRNNGGRNGGRNNGPRNNNNNNNNNQNNNNNNNNGNGQNNPNGDGQAPPVSPAIVKINENGTLDLPYNDAWSQSVLDAFQSMNSELLGINNEQNVNALEHMTANRDIDQQYGALQRDTLSDSAGRGVAFGSGYGMNVAENARMYNNTKNDMATQNSLFNQNTEQSRLAIQNAFNEMLRRDILTRAQEEAADADHESPESDKTDDKNRRNRHDERDKNRNKNRNRNRNRNKDRKDRDGKGGKK